MKNRTAQLMYLTMACTVGVLGIVASFGVFNYSFRWDFYIHFTNLSNYFCIGVLFAELIQTIRKKEDSYVSACPLLKFVGILAILLTFLVFNIMLAPARDASLNFAINSVIFHVLIPIIYIADWFLFYEKGTVGRMWPALSALFPLAYTAFVYIHAALRGFDTSVMVPGTTTPLIYPYFFLNLETQGVLGVAKWVALMLVGFALAGYLFYGLDRIGKRRKG